MDIRIIAFGQIAEVTGKEFLFEAVDVTSLKLALHSTFPALSEKKYAIAVNKRLATENVAFTENDTVALMPPYSGG